MDASSSDRSLEVGRTDSVSTLNYRPRASCTGDTACQEGTRRESKQANRYVQVEIERIERDLSFDVLWSIKLHLVRIDRSRVCYKSICWFRVVICV